MVALSSTDVNKKVVSEHLTGVARFHCPMHGKKCQSFASQLV